MFRTGNPALNNQAFLKNVPMGVTSEVMTLDGTVNKTGLSLLITMAAAYWSYSNPQMAAYLIPLMIGGFILSLIIIFKKTTAPYLTPAYAVAEGLLLGSISLFADMRYPGIVFQAISLTFGTLFALLFAYKSGWIKVTENFKLGIVAATGAICLVYLVSFVLGFFGVQMAFLHDSSPLSIGISVVVVIVAALNLVLDFDFIENASNAGNVPKYMEWYGAFGLLVTLVWLYLEILRLLMKLQDRK